MTANPPQMYVDIRLLSLPMRRRLVTAHDRAGADASADARELVVVCINTPGGSGWGECAALNRPTYTAEHAAASFDLLSAGLQVDPVVAPMAHAAVEMALLDLTLKSAGRSLAAHLGVTATTVPAGVAVGLDALDGTLETISALMDEGYARVKLKVVPGASAAVVAAVRHRFGDLELQVDANASFGMDTLPELRAMADAGVTAIEQPFAVGDLTSLRALTDLVNVPIIADESVATVGDAQALHERGLLGGLSLKAPRLGGLAAAVAMHRRCTGWAVPMTPGGMLECGLGRHALAALAALPGCTITGDVSPARLWLDADPWPDLTMIAGRIAVPTSPGVAPAPDLEVLERFTVRRTRR